MTEDIGDEVQLGEGGRHAGEHEVTDVEEGEVGEEDGGLGEGGVGG